MMALRALGLRYLHIALPAVVLAACAVEPPPTPATPPAPVTLPPTHAAPSPPAPPLPPVTLALTGDIMLGTDYPRDLLPEDSGAGQLAAAREALTAADLAFGNYEGALAAFSGPVKVCKDPSLCYLFRSPPQFALTLADAGYDAISLANNHARDFGEEGRSESMAALSAAGIRHSGREGDAASWSAAGRRVAFVAFAPNVGSNSLLDTEDAAAWVRDLAADHDLVVVSFHGGAEGIDALHLPFGEEFYYGESRGDVLRFARSMVDAGASIVFGHGPHVPRAIELYRGHLIAYSLGNFATFWGISVAGLKGVAPLLLATLDGEGRLIEGRILSLRQQRPEGLVPDPDDEAYRLMRALTEEDLAGGGLVFGADGSFRPAVVIPD